MIEFEVKYQEGKGDIKLDTPVKNDYYTVLICYTGSSSIRVGFHKFELIPHAIAIIPPNVIFSVSHLADDLDLRQIFFVKSFLQKMFLKEEIIDELLLLNSNYPPVYELNERFEIAADRFTAVKREMESQSAYHLDITRLILIEILYEYNRACEYCLLGFEKNMNRNYQLTYEFRRLVDQYFSDWTSIGQYASKLNISAKHLTEVVKEETGYTALQLIHERLLLESQYLLKHTSISVKECALALGFDSASYFSRFFKNHTTISPNDYRKKM